LPTKALSQLGRCVRRAEREELLFILADSSTALVVEDRKTLKNCEIASTPADSFGGLALG